MRFNPSHHTVQLAVKALKPPLIYSEEGRIYQPRSTRQSATPPTFHIHISPSHSHNYVQMAPTTSRVEYSPHKRTRVVTSYDLGVPGRQIALNEGVSLHSIHGIVRRYRVQKSAKSSPRAGRAPIIKDRDKRRILQLIRDDPFISTTQLIEQTSLACSTRTLRRFLVAEGIHRPPAPKVLPKGRGTASAHTNNRSAPQAASPIDDTT